MFAAISLFGHSAQSVEVEALFEALGVYRRPMLSNLDWHSYYDWVAVPRKGLELGFVDSQYQAGSQRSLWGQGELHLVQIYFYAGSADFKTYVGELPFELAWTDSRQLAREKLASYENTRHSHLTDAWDVPGYRLTATYKESGAGVDRIACRVLPLPLRRPSGDVLPQVAAITDAFGETIHAKPFANLWLPRLTNAEIASADEDGELNLTKRFGVTLGFASSAAGPVFRAITLHRARDSDSVGWQGDLPHGLSFDDDPAMLFHKISRQSVAPPVQHSESALTGHAVWHFEDHTLHVMYSNLDNRLLRVKLIAPGTWKCIVD